MFDVASSSQSLVSAFADIGTLIALTLTTVLAAWAGLIGLGFGTRKATKHVTGKKF